MAEFVKAVLVCLFSYLMGSIPFGLIIIYFGKGIDIRKQGSHNVGATNVFRAAGGKYAIWVGCLDAWKCFAPIVLAKYVFNYPFWLVMLVFLCCILGAMFSVFLKFKSGKGVASLIGGSLAILDWQILLAIAIYCVIAFLFFVRRRISLVSLGFAFIFPFIVLATYYFSFAFVFSLLISGLIFYSHRENIKRILKGIESSIPLSSKTFNFTIGPVAEISIRINFDKLPDDVIGLVINKIRRDSK